MNLNKSMNTSHILFHLVYQMVGGIVYGYGIYMLIERGYTSAEAGVCFAIVNIISAFLTPFISNYLDNNDKYSIFDVIGILSLIYFVLIIFNYFLLEKCFILTLVFIIGSSCEAIVDPMVNSISLKLRNYGIDVPYSPARAIGSASYGITCIIFGYTTQIFSYHSVIIGGAIFSFILLIVSVVARNQLNKSQVNKIKEKNEVNDQISFKEFCINNVNFIIIVFFMSLIYIGFATADNFMILICENVGGNSKDMGVILGFKAFIEVIPMLSFPFILKKIKLEKLLYMSAFFYFVKVTIIYLAPNVFMLYVAQVFQGLSYAIMTPAMVEFINRNLKSREVVRGISFCSLAQLIGFTVSSFVSGYIADVFSVKTMNLCAMMITLVGVIGYCITMAYKSKKI